MTTRIDLIMEDKRLLRPDEIIAPGVGDPRLLTHSPVRRATSRADLRPPALRPGGQQFLRMPSRFGNRLYYRGGMVTDIDGNALPHVAWPAPGGDPEDGTSRTEVAPC